MQIEVRLSGPRLCRSRREENPSNKKRVQHRANAPGWGAANGQARTGVAEASSPASSGGVSPPVPTRGETPRELTGETPAVRLRIRTLADSDLVCGSSMVGQKEGRDFSRHLPQPPGTALGQGVEKRKRVLPALTPEEPARWEEGCNRLGAGLSVSRTARRRAWRLL